MVPWRLTAAGSAESLFSPSASLESGRHTSTKAFCRKMCKKPNPLRNSRIRGEFRNAATNSRYVFLLIFFFFGFRSTKRFDGERFEHLAFLNLAQNVVCLIWSFISKILSLITLSL